MKELRSDAGEAGEVGSAARKDIEARTGRPVVTARITGRSGKAGKAHCKIPCSEKWTRSTRTCEQLTNGALFLAHMQCGIANTRIGQSQCRLLSKINTCPRRGDLHPKVRPYALLMM